MRKLFPITLLLLALGLCAFGQNTSAIIATVVDHDTNDGIPGAVITVYQADDSTKLVRQGASEAGGRIRTTVPYGSYRIDISFLGYQTFTKQVRANSGTTDLGKIVLLPEALRIKDVTIQGVSMRTSQKGDTVVYNASSFKVTADADAEGLLSKMPGISVVDGTVEAQGETVKKVFVDGKEFFGGDVTMAIRTLPAEMVSKVEVFNKLSDNAEFSGVDDGEGYKAINIVTLPSAKASIFGKVTAGYGYDPDAQAGVDPNKYILSGNINSFKGSRRISLLGLFNNINQQNFSTEDILGVTGSSSGGFSSRGGSMRSRGGGRGGGGWSSRDFMVGQMDGIAKVASAGINYSDKWGQKIDVQGSYFFNTTKTENVRLSDVEQIATGNMIPFYRDTTGSASRNYNHRINLRMDYKISDKQTLMWRPEASFQNYTNESATSRRDELLSPDYATQLKQLVDDIFSGRNSKSHGYNISNGLFYRLQLGKPGRTIMADVSGSLSKNDNTASSDWHKIYYPEGSRPDSILLQRSLNNSNSYRIGGSVQYTEPLSKISQIYLQYQARYSYSDADRQTEVSNGIDPFAFNPDYSNKYNSGYMTHTVGPGYRLGGEKTTAIANVSYQLSDLTSDRTYPQTYNLSRTFNNVVFFGMLNQAFNPQNTLRIYLRSRTSNPSISQLQDVVDISNPQNITQGNPQLVPSMSYSLSTTYTNSVVNKGRTFMVGANASVISNYIGESIVRAGPGGTTVNGIDLDPNAQYTRQINMSGYRSLGGFSSFGVPLTFMKSNLNLNVGMNYARTPSILNDEKNFSNTYFMNGGAVLGSNISENLDFTFTYNGGYNIVKNTVMGSDNKFFSHYATGKFKWITWAGITLTGNASFSQSKGITVKYDEQFLIINFQAGKKIFKNNRGEISVGAYDILNQNKSFARSVTATAISNVTNRVMGRYFGINFVYNIRSFAARQRGDGAGSGSSQGTGEGGPRVYMGPGGPGGEGGGPRTYSGGPGGPGPGGPPPGM